MTKLPDVSLLRFQRPKPIHASPFQFSQESAASIDIAPQFNDGSEAIAAIEFRFPVAAVGIPDQIVCLAGQFRKQHRFRLTYFPGQHAAQSFDYRFHADTLHADAVAEQAIPIAAEAGKRMDHRH